MLSWSVVGGVAALGMTESRNRSTFDPLLFQVVLNVHGGSVLLGISANPRGA